MKAREPPVHGGGDKRCGRRNPQVGCIMRCWQAATSSQQTPHSESSGEADEEWSRMLQKL